MSTINERIIAKINKELGSDIDNLHKSKQLVKNLKQNVHDIEGKV